MKGAIRFGFISACRELFFPPRRFAPPKDCPLKSCTSDHGFAGNRESVTATGATLRKRPILPTTRLAPTMTHRTIALCCWCLLLLAVLAAEGLPITSKPLDNNPDHLTWEAAWLSEDTRAPMPLGGKSKKITPKSIFITPFLNSYNTSACPPDYKVDYNGKCIQVVSINTADILVTKLQSLFSQHGDGGGNGAGTGEDDYDYDYDATGPFQVNLPLSIDLSPEPALPAVAQPPKYTYKDVPAPSFYDSAMVEIASADQDKAKITTVAMSDPEKPSSEKPFLATSTTTAGRVDQNGAETAHPQDISFLAFESLPNGTLVGQVELEGSNRTVVQSIFVSSTTPSAVPVADAGSTTEPTVAELDGGSTGTTTDRDGDTGGTDVDALVSSSTQEVSTGSTVPASTGSVTTTDREEEEATDVGSTVPTSTTEQDTEDIKLELEEELLLMDSNRSSLAPPQDTATTDVSEMDLDTLPTSETQPSDEPTMASKDPEPVPVSTTVSPPRPALAPIPPTKPSLQIITPIKGNWDLGLRAASHLVQQDRTTRATPETTTPAVIQSERSTEEPSLLVVPHESLVDRKNSEEVQRQEAQHAVREANEASNRFVYHHLPAATVEAIVSSTTESTVDNSVLQVRPLAATPPTGGNDNNNSNNNYLEQLRKINEIVAEKRRHQQQQEQQLSGGTASSATRIRFPSRDEDHLTGSASTASQQSVPSGVRFPGSATNRLTPTSNRLPDIFPKKSPDSTTQRPAFWWLPSGWEVDQTGNKPMLLRFWSRMPLVRDSSIQPAPASVHGEPNADTNRWRSATGFQQQQQQQHHQAQQTGSNQQSHPVATARGNSKSPSENFYKEVSAQEVYKVMNARQLHQHHQRR
uniref:Folded gastrulation N-terminal domain-containing protein n=1 Tax=Anopheles farauti TaxID=69004 RepID=A0A182Q990_9DIPT